MREGETAPSTLAGGTEGRALLSYECPMSGAGTKDQGRGPGVSQRRGCACFPSGPGRTGSIIQHLGTHRAHSVPAIVFPILPLAVLPDRTP